MITNRREFLVASGAIGVSTVAAGVPGSNNAADAPVPIDVGRQLFVDDFLIAKTDLKRSFHTARLHESSPVLSPETPLEMNGGKCPVACPFEDGVFWDPKDRLFKMWYHAGWFDAVAYAVSEDGIRWRRPRLDVEPGTNRVLAKRKGYWRDGTAVWLDHAAADPTQRFKMFVFQRRLRGDRDLEWMGGEVYTSPDGIHWSGPTETGPCGDNTGFFYNPFRKKWVYSIRSFKLRGKSESAAWEDVIYLPRDVRTGDWFRVRSYREHDDFLRGAAWDMKDVVYWVGPDDLDLPDPDLGYKPELYKLAAVAYESVMLGLFALFKGPPNEVCKKGGFPKTIDLFAGFSRDGLQWHRPDRRPLIACSRRTGEWNRGYLHSAGGVCLIVGDQIYFYYGAWSGVSPQLGTNQPPTEPATAWSSPMYAGGSTGLAVLRRDGFASMDAGTPGGSLMTRPVTFNGKHLFVNCETGHGELCVEVLDRTGRVLKPFSRAECIPVRSDKTKHAVRWRNAADVGRISDKPVRFRFYLVNGRLYSFWVSPDPSGASHGYVAAGGPGFTGSTDTTGT